ncbi:hypothetical protein CGCF415_v007194 [Colletotrichum fructicola]|uniref:Uncharacterized protein n=1 Tax=Colletotrichum fructicola (strain Nara gc5) TaxID=1213859 RepID=L2FBU9_COLFN|nr:uncharacterized protein CGMCC3_g3818 [Colletotrichum fructicola]KAF4479202.1 hypothetical protein CGGC5_v011976 [Colletotrichum fructicola Nara gc5]KAE9580061.1 hypothetical protein CGMCC3_g3818 [Colletotrichum fructicola]KAF4433885.1 hypothetical protein CFRS1_v010634 [Colletotrichum fructicola]KAF4898560.1 hypothetical protein CGCFRS4_v004462 [Colletotrichum fructicola]KAF4907684.1 hypothetical protein CGCF415_v007194 [Colletotrichum fructicola]
MAYSESQSSTIKRAAAAQLPFTKEPNTCGFIEAPTSAPTISPKDQAWTCPGPCISSNSFLGCRSPVPTKCLGSSAESIAGGCKEGELCCRYRPDTACYTWLSTDDASTFTLYECSSTSGTGNLLASPTDLPGPTLTTIIDPTSKILTGPKTPSAATASPLPTSTQEPQQEASKGAIAASVAGALAFLGLLAGGVVYLYIWNKKKKKREGPTGLHRRGSMAISGPYLVSGLPPKFPPPPPAPPRPPMSPGVYDMEVFDQGRGTSSMYSTKNYVERGSEGFVPPALNAPGRPRRDGEAVSGGWI